ncbi:hypothetical protein Dimus_003889 [Dionaea muscipula]
MALAKTKKVPKTTAEDVENIKFDVASFASSLGLSSSVPNSGFNDTDFRKTGPLKPSKIHKPQTTKSNQEHPRQSFKKPNSQTLLNNKKNPRFQKPSPQIAGNNKNNPAFQPRAKSNAASNNGRNYENNSVGGNSHDYRLFERFKNLPKLPLVKPNGLGIWHVDVAELEGKVMEGERKRVETGDAEEWKNLVGKKKELGERLLAQYTMEYEASRGQSGDIKMLLTTQRSGTAVDKVSAHSVLVGDNPLANMRSLDALLAMVTSKVGKRHALTAFEALKELFIQSLLPDRKLKALIQQPLSHLSETKDGNSLLLFWYWEECLKLRYERFISALEEASRDMLPILKDKSLKTIYVLLKSKSEQERRLLSSLVNKLGDPENKAASNADFHLSNLLSEHPNMKVVVIDEVDSFLFRPHLGLKAKYHAVNFLTKIRLSHRREGPKVAKRLIGVYFALFKVLISDASPSVKASEDGKMDVKKAPSKEKDAKSSSESHVELDSRLLSVLLTGVNRAFPFVSSNEVDEIIELQTPMLFQLVHSKNFNVGIQALMLLDKISSKNQVASDRFYRALYSKMLLPAAMNSSKEEMFIGLLLRAMKSDINIKRVAAFSKRLLQVALQQPPQYACGCLFLLSEVLKARPALWTVVLQSELVDEELEHFEDAPDETVTQPMADAKQGHGEVVDARINSQVGAEIDSLQDEDDDDEDEEVSPESSSEEDVSDDAEELIMSKPSEALKESESNRELFDHDKNQEPESIGKASLPGGYDPQHREPSFCKADRVSWWELIVLASHVHPSVSTMAKTLLSGVNIVYNGNPLNDLSLTAFLDKFMEKKAKLNVWHGGSEIEPAKKLDMSHDLIGPEILSLAEEDVLPEDVVFHRFYMNKIMHSSKKPKKKKKKAAEDEAAENLYGGEGDDSDDEEEIDNVVDAGGPPLIDADGDYDYDDLDRIAADEDDDLLVDTSDVEMEIPAYSNEVKDDDDDVVVPSFGSSDDDSDDGPPSKGNGKRKQKTGKMSKGSPFASLEEYEHLLNDDDEDHHHDYRNGDVDGDGRRDTGDKNKVRKNKPSRKRKAENKNKPREGKKKKCLN